MFIFSSGRMTKRLRSRCRSQGLRFSGIDVDQIASILMFRSDPSTLPAEAKAIASLKDFKSLPSLKKKQISKLMKQIYKTEDVSASLSAAGVPKSFSSDKARELSAQLSKNASQQPVVAVTFLFHCLYFLAAGPGVWKSENMRVLLDGLSKLVPTVFIVQAREMFLILSVELLNLPGCEPEMEDFVTMHKFYMMDKEMPAASFDVLNAIIVTGLRVANDPMIAKQSVVFLAGLLEENRAVLSGKQWDSLLEAADPLITDLDPSTISITFKIAAFYNSDLMVRLFRRFPAVFYQKIVSGNVMTNADELTIPRGSHTLAEWEKLKETEGETALPAHSMLNGTVTPKNFVPNTVLFLATTVPMLLKSVTKPNMDAFQRTVSELIQSIEDSEHAVDLVMFYSIFLPYLDREHVLEMIKLFSKSPVFSPTATIYAENGLSDFQNGLRNFIFRTLAKTDIEFFADLLQQCESPWLFSEHLARVMIEVPEIESEFFMCEKMMRCFGSNMTRMKLDTETESIQISIARNVIYSYIFSLLNDPSTALLCFSSEVFSSTVTLIVFDKVVREAVFGCIRRTITTLDKLPLALQNFVVCLYTTCIENYTDDDTYQLVLMMTSTLVDGVLHNPRLSKSCLVIIPHLLKFTALTSSSETLDAILTLYTLCLRDKLLTRHEKLTYFSEVVDLVSKLENDEQRQVVYKKLINSIADSTAVQLNQQFSIRVIEMIPVVFFSMVATPLFRKLIEFFTDLCRFSERNVIAFLDSGLPLLLIGCLKGTITHFDVVREVKLSLDEKQAVVKLLTALMSVGTSFAMEQGLVELVQPNEQHAYSDCAFDVLNSITEVIDASDRKAYPIFSKTPILTIDNFDCPNINISFCLAFWVKIDSGYIGSNERSYVLFDFEDATGAHISFSYSGGSIVMSVVISEGVSASRLLFELTPETKWHYITFAINKQHSVMNLYRYLDFEPLQNMTFPVYKIGTKVKFTVGHTNETLACDEYCPVVLGDFALIDLPYSDVQVGSLACTGFDALDEFEHILVTNTTHQVIDSRKRVADRVFRDSFCERLDAGRWLRMFSRIENAPQYYLERLLSLCLKLYSRFSARLCISFEDRMGDWEEILSRLSGIEVSMLHNWNSVIDFSNENTPSMIGAVVGYVARQNSLSLHLYKVIWSEAEAFPDVYPNILFNLFIWNCLDPPAMRKIFGFWVAEIASIIRDHHLSLFESLLVQMHVLASYSSRNVDEIRTWRMRIFEQVLASDFKPSYYELVVACLAVSVHPEEVVFYVDLLNMMPQRDALDPQSVYVNLVSIITKAGSSPVPVLYELLLSSSGCDISMMENQLGLHLLLLDSSLEVPQTLIFKCIQLVSQNQVDSGTLQELENYSVSMGSMWPLWPITAAILHPNTASILVEKVIDAIHGSVRFMLWFETVLNILDVCDSHRLGQTSNFRSMFICGLCKRLIQNQDFAETIDLPRFIVRCAFSMFFSFRHTFHSPQLLKLFEASSFDSFPSQSNSPDDPVLSPLMEVITLFSTHQECRFVFEPREKDDIEVVLSDLIEVKCRTKPVFTDRVSQVVDEYLDSYKGSVRIGKDKVFSVLMEEFAPQIQTVAAETATEIEKFLMSPVPADFVVYWTNIEKIIRKDCFKFLVLLATNVQKPYQKSISFERFIRFPLQNQAPRMRGSGRCSDACRTSWEVRIFVHRNLTFSLMELQSNSCIFRTGDLKKYFKIAYENIQCVVMSPSHDCFEIFCKHCDSYRVKTSKEKLIEIFNKFGDYNVSVVRDLEAHIMSCVQQWSSGLMSNLGLVFSLNFLNGRSFNSRKEFLFPGNISTLRDAAECSPGEHMECLTKLIEFEKGGLSRDWFKRNFQVELPERQFSAIVSEHPSKILLKRKLRKVFFIPRMYCCYCELEDHTFHFVKYKTSKGEVVFKEVADFTLGSRLVAMPQPDQLRLYDMDLAMVHKLVMDRVLSREGGRCRMGACCVAGNSVYFVLDRTTIAVSPVVTFPIERRVIVYEKEAITMMACNPRIDVIAYVLESGTIKVVTCPTGEIVGTFSGSEWEIKRLLVSNNWCFICIETDRELIVVNRQGKVISRTKKNFEIKLWATFSTNMADDYLLVFDVFGDARIAELANIADMFVLAETKENILNVQITQNPLSVTAVSEQGSIFTIPICL